MDLPPLKFKAFETQEIKNEVMQILAKNKIYPKRAEQLIDGLNEVHQEFCKQTGRESASSDVFSATELSAWKGALETCQALSERSKNLDLQIYPLAELDQYVESAVTGALMVHDIPVAVPSQINTSVAKGADAVYENETKGSEAASNRGDRDSFLRMAESLQQEFPAAYYYGGLEKVLHLPLKDGTDLGGEYGKLEYAEGWVLTGCRSQHFENFVKAVKSAAARCGVTEIMVVREDAGEKEWEQTGA